jgi:multicomponent Na+:H+ antiporter subunit D
MVKIWAEGFLVGAGGEEIPAEARRSPPLDLARTPLSMLVPVAVLAFLAIVLGLAAGPIHDVTMRAAGQLLDPQQYIDAVRPQLEPVP